MLKNILAVVFAVFALLGAGPSHAGEKSKKTVYFGAITLYHPVVMYQKYQPLMTYLTQNTPYRFELKLNQDYRRIVEYLDRKEVQIALLGGSTYVRARERTNLVPILKPLGADGTPFYRCAFIARSDNASIRKLSDLRGKSVAFPSVLSTSGFMMPVYCLYTKAGISLNDLKSHQNFRYHDLVAREVLRGSFDAGVVIDHVAGQYEGRGLKTVMKSDPIPSLPFVVRADEDPALIRAVKKALLALDYRNPEHRAIMSRWDAELQYGFTEAADRDYDGVREIIRFLETRRLLAD